MSSVSKGRIAFLIRGDGSIDMSKVTSAKEVDRFYILLLPEEGDFHLMELANNRLPVPGASNVHEEAAIIATDVAFEKLVGSHVETLTHSSKMGDEAYVVCEGRYTILADHEHQAECAEEDAIAHLESLDKGELARLSYQVDHPSTLSNLATELCIANKGTLLIRVKALPASPGKRQIKRGRGRPKKIVSQSTASSQASSDVPTSNESGPKTESQKPPSPQVEEPPSPTSQAEIQNKNAEDHSSSPEKAVGNDDKKEDSSIPEGEADESHTKDKDAQAKRSEPAHDSSDDMDKCDDGKCGKCTQCVTAEMNKTRMENQPISVAYAMVSPMGPIPMQNIHQTGGLGFVPLNVPYYGQTVPMGAPYVRGAETYTPANPPRTNMPPPSESRPEQTSRTNESSQQYTPGQQRTREAQSPPSKRKSTPSPLAVDDYEEEFQRMLHRHSHTHAPRLENMPEVDEETIKRLGLDDGITYKDLKESRSSAKRSQGTKKGTTMHSEAQMDQSQPKKPPSNAAWSPKNRPRDEHGRFLPIEENSKPIGKEDHTHRSRSQIGREVSHSLPRDAQGHFMPKSNKNYSGQYQENIEDMDTGTSEEERDHGRSYRSRSETGKAVARSLPRGEHGQFLPKGSRGAGGGGEGEEESEEDHGRSYRSRSETGKAVARSLPRGEHGQFLPKAQKRPYTQLSADMDEFETTASEDQDTSHRSRSETSKAVARSLPRGEHGQFLPRGSRGAGGGGEGEEESKEDHGRSYRSRSETGKAVARSLPRGEHGQFLPRESSQLYRSSDATRGSRDDSPRRKSGYKRGSHGPGGSARYLFRPIAMDQFYRDEEEDCVVCPSSGISSRSYRKLSRANIDSPRKDLSPGPSHTMRQAMGHAQSRRAASQKQARPDGRGPPRSSESDHPSGIELTPNRRHRRPRFDLDKDPRAFEAIYRMGLADIVKDVLGEERFEKFEKQGIPKRRNAQIQKPSAPEGTMQPTTYPVQERMEKKRHSYGELRPRGYEGITSTDEEPQHSMGIESDEGGELFEKEGGYYEADAGGSTAPTTPEHPPMTFGPENQKAKLGHHTIRSPKRLALQFVGQQIADFDESPLLLLSPAPLEVPDEVVTKVNTIVCSNF